jgi:putative aldouronate transport system permease protein
MKQAYGEVNNMVVESKSVSGRIFDIINTLFLVLLMIVTLYPFIYVLFASFSIPARFLKHDFTILYKPLGFQTETYRLVLQNAMIVRGFFNSVFYVLAGCCISMFLTFLGAYALSRTGYYFKRALTFFVLFTMYFSGGLIPTFLWVQELGLLDTIWAILLPNAMSTYNMIVLRTAFAAVPKSLEESVKIDGGNDFVILFRIMIPLCIPTIAVVGLFYAVGRWNEWFNAVIYLRTRILYPMQLILREILITGTADYIAQNASMGVGDELTAARELIKYAAIIITTVPILVVYPFIQKYFVKGMMLGALKE